MSRVIAALDNSLAARPVLSTAIALGALLGSEVESVHVGEDGDRIARGVAEAAGLELDVEPGPVVERMTEIAEAGDVVALVLGARGTHAARRPLGSTALALATSLSKPIVVVPPDVTPVEAFETILVPVEGVLESAPAQLEAVLQPSEQSELEVVILHVYEEATMPSFTDQPQHERDAWSREFLRRHCPWSAGRLRLELRTGRSEDVIPRMARESTVNMVALCWAQEVGEERAPVVRALLAHGRTPVMLIPVSGS
jgi:nucleotide-binding universal stress UspA family protein